MISKENLMELEFNSLEEYFNYIVESRINGNFRQMKELVEHLSSHQWLRFAEYVLDNCPDEKIINYIKAREG